ncbi:MAG: 50S ribosomal protein L3 N(5)-glutamine methyltransferase [Pseudomonadota bacterium]
MAKVSRPAAPIYGEDCIRWAAARLARAPLVSGHGTDNPFDEAAALVFGAAGWPHSAAPDAYRWALPVAARRRLERFVERRVRERVPSAYLTGRTWFAGHEIRVDERVLVPRSPIAELIEHRFRPFVAPDTVKRVLDVGTGSGCIAIACAHAFPRARVDAADVSADALEVARDNIRLHRLERRVRAVLSNVYGGLGATRYDLIVSNPPYVPSADVDALPEEYAREPRLGLDAGHDGLDTVRRILAGAADRLTPAGVLVVEVGDSDERVQAAWPAVPFLWLEFERGGGGVFLLSRDTLVEHRRALAPPAAAGGTRPRARRVR